MIIGEEAHTTQTEPKGKILSLNIKVPFESLFLRHDKTHAASLGPHFSGNNRWNG